MSRFSEYFHFIMVERLWKRYLERHHQVADKEGSFACCLMRRFRSFFIDSSGSSQPSGREHIAGKPFYLLLFDVDHISK